MANKFLDNFLLGFKKGGQLFIDKGTEVLSKNPIINRIAGGTANQTQRHLEDFMRGKSAVESTSGGVQRVAFDQSSFIPKRVDPAQNYRVLGQNLRQNEAFRGAAMGAIGTSGAANEFIHVTSKINAQKILKEGFDPTKRSTHYFGKLGVESPKVMGNTLNASKDPKTIEAFKLAYPDAVEMKVKLAPDAKIIRATGDQLLGDAFHAFPNLAGTPEKAINEYVTKVLKADAVISPDPIEGLAVYNLKKVQMMLGDQVVKESQKSGTNASAGISSILKTGGVIAGLTAAPAVSKRLLGILEKIIPGREIVLDRKEYYNSLPKQEGEFTMYNPVPGQTDDQPEIMASGKKIYDGAMAAPPNIPFGTRVYVPELDREFVVEDRMNARYRSGNYFDILHTKGDAKSVDEAKRFGRQKLHFIIVGHDGRKNAVEVSR